MTNPKHTDTSRSGDLVDDDFAPIWDESILLAEHEAVQASVDVGGWLSAALDDPNVCDAMKADINRWFSAGFLYLDEVRKLMQTEREALEAEVERLREALGLLSAVGLTIPADRIRDDDHVIITYKTFRALRTALERIDHD